ncbi:MAG: radical SAM protein [Candidatus Kapaibacterium sp.]
MKILAKTKSSDIATVYVAEISHGKLAEMVESVQPPIPREDKWVLIISTLYGCPVECRFCDCGGDYKGRIDEAGLLAQIDFLIKSRYPGGKIPVRKIKIQFARIGEPAYNPAVVSALWKLPLIYDISGMMPSISTVAPAGREKFFENLMDVKHEIYPDSFQMQFSVHSTDQAQRDSLIPVKKMNFSEISDYGERFYGGSGRKITLNFAISKESIIDAAVLKHYFNQDVFIIKVTPVNPTYSAMREGLANEFNGAEQELINSIEESGFRVIKSVGELEENRIGSNCGQHIMNFLKRISPEETGSYTYNLEYL